MFPGELKETFQEKTTEKQEYRLRNSLRNSAWTHFGYSSGPKSVLQTGEATVLSPPSLGRSGKRPPLQPVLLVNWCPLDASTGRSVAGAELTSRTGRAVGVLYRTC